MIMDSTLEMLDAVAINTGGAGTYLLGSQIDTSVVRDIGQGKPVYLIIEVDTACASATGTLQLKLASDSSAAIATDGTASEHWVSDTFLQAALTAGKYWVVPLPAGDALPYERYLGILQVTGTAAFTAGKLNAFLTLDPFGWKAYADATN